MYKPKSRTECIRGDARLIARIDTEPDWTRRCSVCGASPVLPSTGMCRPCTEEIDV